MDPQEIQRLLTQKRQDLGQRQAEAANVVSKYSPATDATVNALRGQQADKIKELFSHDQQLASTYFQPQAAPAAPGETVPQPEPRLIDPTIGLRASSQQTLATAGEVGDILRQIETRKDYLSSERDKALSVLDRMVTINDREVRMLQDQLDRYEKQKADKVTNALNVLGLAGGTLPDEVADAIGLARGTRIPSEMERRVPTEREQTQSVVDDLIGEIQTGRNRPHLLEYVMKKYSNRLKSDDILYYYNIHSPFGPAKESSEELYGKYGVSPQAVSAQISKKQQQDAEMANIVSTLNQYSQKRRELGARAFNPYDPLTSEVNTQKDLFSQILGKYIEVGGRGLSDKDRQFYANQIPGAVYIQGSAEGKIKGVKSSILGKAGYYEVKEKATGRVGVIPKEEFNPKLYIKLAP